MVNTAASKFTPGLADKLAVKQSSRQQYDEIPLDPEGTLYKPGHEGHIHGNAHI